VDGLLNRNAVVSAFRSDDGVLSPIVDQLLRHLPPSWCEQLAFGKVVDETDELAVAFTGSRDSVLDWWQHLDDLSVAFLRGRDVPFATSLPLDGHTIEPDIEPLIHRTMDVLDRFQEVDESRSRHIAEWTSMIVWMCRARDSKTALLTSSTFPALPHCTFVTQKGFRHIPPVTIFDHDSEYALFENLYHESLHQQLASTLLHRNVLSDQYWAATATRIRVPWRGGSWEPDRVLHAVWVYLHLVRLRREHLGRAVNARDRRFIEHALIDGCQALEYLASQLALQRTLFGPEGDAVRALVLAGASSVLAEHLGRSDRV